MSSTASCSRNTITGGSFFIISRLSRSSSADSRLAVRRSSEVSKPDAGRCASTIAVKRCSSASVESGQRTFVSVTSRMSTVPASRSVSMRATNQNAPKIGSSRFSSSSDIAARPESTLPSSLSGCGW